MPQRTVLIVDDDESVRMFVAGIMEDMGWQCIEARNGLDGVEMAEDERPDLIVMDIRMPVMDGFEAFRRMRDSPKSEKIPIIILSSVNEESGREVPYTAEDFELAFGLPKPEGFVDKPVTADHLRKCILGVIG